MYDHPAALPDNTLLEQCVMGQSRSSGPGGQHRNKVSTQVTLTHQPTGIAATAGERRSQRDNKSLALRRLRLKLAVEVRNPVPDGPIGSELLESRKIKPKREPHTKDDDDAFFKSIGITLRQPNDTTTKKRLAVSARHRDFPAILAEILDTLAASKWDAKHAAVRLGVSQSQLLKLIRNHPPALAHLNEQRRDRSLHVYH